MNYERMLQAVQAIKALFLAGTNDSPYVCDNIEDVTNDKEDDIATAIRDDIDEYIDGAWSVRNWMNKRDGTNYDNDDEEVMQERIRMLDFLIEKYTYKLQVN